MHVWIPAGIDARAGWAGKEAGTVETGRRDDTCIGFDPT